MILVLDIDGTIADTSHRDYLIDKENPTEEDWAEFDKSENVEKDTPFLDAQLFITNYWDFFEDIYFLTGRMEHLRETTREWLLEHYGIEIAQGEEDHLLMRGNDDLRPGAEFKREEVERLSSGLPEGISLLFVDDQVDNLEVFKEFGLTFLAPGCWEYMSV